MSHPNDQDGVICGVDDPRFPILYFTSLSDTSKRVCVSKCPTAADTRLACLPTKALGCTRNDHPKYEVSIYASFT